MFHADICMRTPTEKNIGSVFSLLNFLSDKMMWRSPPNSQVVHRINGTQMMSHERFPMCMQYTVPPTNAMEVAFAHIYEDCTLLVNTALVTVTLGNSLKSLREALPKRPKRS